jgi:hypothetical protein
VAGKPGCNCLSAAGDRGWQARTAPTAAAMRTALNSRWRGYAGTISIEIRCGGEFRKRWEQSGHATSVTSASIPIWRLDFVSGFVCAVQQRQHRRAEVERGAPDLVRCQRVETHGVPYVTR